MKVMQWMVMALMLCACALPPAPPTASPDSQAMKKINIDLSEIDANGMIGPADGKRYASYEFCIPRDEAKKTEVKAIDPSIQFYTSPGRIRCTSNEYLCIGQAGTREILLKLAKLNYIDRIDPFYGE